MKESKKYINLSRLEGLEFGGYVESLSSPGTKYFVSKKTDGWHCECISFLSGNLVCRHIKQLAKLMAHEDKHCFYCDTSKLAAGHLEAHHVFRRSTSPELKDDPENLMLLCPKCHYRATHEREFEVLLQTLWQLRKQ